MAYEPGSFVWAKVGRVWWAGQVTDDYPEDLVSSMKKQPVAVVKFVSSSEEYEIVKKEAEILPYNHEKKEEFIRKGKLHLQKNKDDLAKFILDTRHNEKETGGDQDLVEKVSTAPTVPKKPAYAEIFKSIVPPVVPPTPPRTPGSILLNFKKSGASPAKRPRPSLPTPQIVDGKKYSCDQCGFTTDRVGVIGLHRKSHSVAVVETKAKLASPKPKAQASTVERSTPKPKPQQEPSKKTAVEKTTTPRKRKAPKEQAKQEILADWSDGEGDDAERKEKSPGPDEPIEQKKPRTHKEISDAFDNLLSSTMPPKIPTFELSSQNKSDIPSSNLAGTSTSQKSETETAVAASSSKDYVVPFDALLKATTKPSLFELSAEDKPDIKEYLGEASSSTNEVFNLDSLIPKGPSLFELRPEHKPDYAFAKEKMLSDSTVTSHGKKKAVSTATNSSTTEEVLPEVKLETETVESSSEVKVDLKDESKDEVKDESKEEVKDESKDEVKVEAKDEMKTEVKNEKKDVEVKPEVKDEDIPSVSKPSDLVEDSISPANPAPVEKVHQRSPRKQVISKEPAQAPSPIRNANSAKLEQVPVSSPVRATSPVRVISSPIRNVSPVRATTSPVRSVSPVRGLASPVRNPSPVRASSPVKNISIVQPTTTPVRNISPVRAIPHIRNISPVRAISPRKEVPTVKQPEPSVDTVLQTVTTETVSTSLGQPAAPVVSKPTPKSILKKNETSHSAAADPVNPVPVTQSAALATPPMTKKVGVAVASTTKPPMQKQFVQVSSAATNPQSVQQVAVTVPTGLPKSSAPVKTAVPLKAAVPMTTPGSAKMGPIPKVSATVAAVSKAPTATSTPVDPSKKIGAKSSVETPKANPETKVVPSPTVTAAKAPSSQNLVQIKPTTNTTVGPVLTSSSPAATSGLTQKKPPPPVKSPGTTGTVRIAGPVKPNVTPTTPAGTVQITATKSAPGAGGKSVTFTSPVAITQAEPTPTRYVIPKLSAQSSLTVKATTQGLQIKPAPSTSTPDANKKTPQKSPASVTVKPGPGILKTPTTPAPIMPDTPVIAVKSAPQPYIPKPKGGKKNEKSPAAPPPAALSQQILIVPPVAPPPNKIADLRTPTMAGGTPKKGRARKQSVTTSTPGTPQPQKFIQQKASPIGQPQQLATIKFDAVTGQLLQPQLSPVVSQTPGAKIHGLPQNATSVAPLPPIKVNPGVVQTVQSVTTKVHALPVPSTSASIGTTVQRPALTRRMGDASTESQAQQPTSASQMLQHQQAISQMIGVPVKFDDASQTYTVVPQGQTAGVSGTQEKTSGEILTGKLKKQGSPKKPIQTYGRRQVESPKPKPTATIKPTMNDEEAGSAKLRQALQQKPEQEKTYVADNVVHLVPVENMDGSVTYMIVQLDDAGALRIDSTEGPMMTQTMPDAIFIDKPTDGQKILQALTQPVASNPPANTSAVVTQPQVMYRQAPTQTVSQTVAHPSSQPVAIAPAPAPAPAQPQPIAPGPAQTVPVQAAPPQTVQPLSTQQIYLQRNGDGSQVQVAPTETLETTNASGEPIQVQLQVTGDGTQQMMTLEEVLNQGQIQYEPQPGTEYLAYEDAMQQVQMGDGTMIDLSQFAGGGEHQILFLQEDGTLIDPAAMGIDISQFMQVQQPTEPN